MSDQLKTAALAYAATLVEYHELNEHAKVSELREDKQAARYAYDAMCDAMNTLNDVALASVA